MQLLYVYGKVFDRNDATTVKFTIEAELIQQLLKLKEEGTDEQKDEYQDRVEESTEIGPILRRFLWEFMVGFDMKDEIAKAKAGKSFYIMTEEAGYGLAETREQAQLVFTKGEEQHGDSDVGQEGGW